MGRKPANRNAYEWINVDDRLPREEVVSYILACTTKGARRPYLCTWIDKEFCFENPITFDMHPIRGVTHWAYVNYPID